MQSLLLWVFAFVSGKNVESFFEVDANGPFKKTGRELRRIKEDDSGERLGFLSKVEGAEGSRTLNGSDLFSIPRQLGVHSSSRRNADEGRGNTESSQPPEGTQQREPAAIRSDIPRASVPEETAVPEEDNFAEKSRLLNDSDLGVSIPRQFAIPSNIYHEETEDPEADDCGSVPEDTCAICLEPKNGESFAPFECATVKHDYHKECAEGWIEKSRANPTCPSCRAGLPSDSPLMALRPAEQDGVTQEDLELLGITQEDFDMFMRGFEERFREFRERREERERRERRGFRARFRRFMRGIRRNS